MGNLSVKKVAATSFSSIKRMLPGIFVFELAYKLLTYVIFKPLLAGILQLLLRIGGEPLAFNNSIWTFLLTPQGIIAVVLLLILSALFIYYEYAVITLFANDRLSGRDRSIWHSVRMAFTTFGSLKNFGVFGFAVYSLVLLPFVGLGLSSSLFPSLVLPNFITGELMKNSWGPVLLFGAGAAVAVLFFINLFIIPVMVLEGASFGKAAKRAPRILKQSGKKMAGICILFLIVWAVLAGLPRLVFTQLLGNANVGVEDISAIYGASWQGVLLTIFLFITSIAQLFVMPVLLTVVVGFYLHIDPQVCLREEALEKVDANMVKIKAWLVKAFGYVKKGFLLLREKYRASVHRKKIRNIAIAGAVIVTFFVLGNLFVSLPGLHPPMVVGHRGSAYGVENTLEAIRASIDAGADYVEADVVLSGDGVPMVMHDTNLSRLAGEDVNVYDLDAAELQKLTLRQNGYTGKISTLDEVAKYCKDKISLAIELKAHGHESKDLVDESMRVMRENGIDDFMLLSIEYNFVAQLKERYPKNKVGYCVYGNIGSLDTAQLIDMNIDFIVVEEWMATSSLVKDFRKAWIPVYVWTVNDARSMQKYLDRGILGIVTDYPDIAADIVKRFRSQDNSIYMEDFEIELS